MHKAIAYALNKKTNYAPRTKRSFTITGTDVFNGERELDVFTITAYSFNEAVLRAEDMVRGTSFRIETVKEIK